MILKSFDAYSGIRVVASAIRLARLLLVRPGELRTAEWSQMNWERAEWRYQVSKTRNSGVAEHIVPLSTQAVGILRELQAVTGRGRLIFPSAGGVAGP